MAHKSTKSKDNVIRGNIYIEQFDNLNMKDMQDSDTYIYIKIGKIWNTAIKWSVGNTKTRFKVAKPFTCT